MSWRLYKPVSAVPTIWGYFPLAAWEAFAAGAVHLSASLSRLIQLERHKFFRIYSYEKRPRKPFAICTYEVIGLEVSWNQHLQKRGWGDGGGAARTRCTTSLVPRMSFAEAPHAILGCPSRT